MPVGREVFKLLRTGASHITFDSILVNCTHLGFWNAPKGGTFYGAIPVNFSVYSRPGFTTDIISIDNGNNTRIELSIYEPVYKPNEGYFQPSFQVSILHTALIENLYLYLSLHIGDPLDTGANEIGTAPHFDSTYRRIDLQTDPHTGYWWGRRI